MKARLELRIPVSWDVRRQSGSWTSKETCNILPYPRSPECSIILLWKLQTLERQKLHEFFHIHVSTLYTKMKGYRIFGKKSNMQGVNFPLLTKTIYWRFSNKYKLLKTNGHITSHSKHDVNKSFQYRISSKSNPLCTMLHITLLWQIGNCQVLHSGRTFMLRPPESTLMLFN